MAKFVCVRLVQGNGLDLALFQFDYDLTFSVFMLHADGTILGRYGTRSSHDEAERDISLRGFRLAMEKALDLHRDFPLYRASLAAKRGPAPAYKVPEELPSLKEKFTAKLDYEGQVAKSCIHCHQLRDADLQTARNANTPITDEVLYPYPMPDVLGLTIDPESRTSVSHVRANSTASQAGFRVGDELVTLAGQPLTSIADVQWVLHHAKSSDTLAAQVQRGSEKVDLKLALQPGWRRGDFAWRVTTWDLRRMATGGLFSEDLSNDKRRERNLPDDKLALFVKHVGQFGPHALAKNEGFLNNDIIISVDGRTERLTETQFLDYMLRHVKRGAKVESVVLRGGKEVKLKIPTQ